ncbi:hypothetical protein PLESTB_000169500 [Pleodorina starrii]|uniref:Uncharacterized protein n=1 Tax=Pleodorina starrii TaxID=330485 RepID=A0A9W6BC07_9CHLO|nr:hypothetical protein PLESTB_000169500 [Pleodorina starrii]
MSCQLGHPLAIWSAVPSMDIAPCVSPTVRPRTPSSTGRRLLQRRPRLNDLALLVQQQLLDVPAALRLPANSTAEQQQAWAEIYRIGTPQPPPSLTADTARPQTGHPSPSATAMKPPPSAVAVRPSPSCAAHSSLSSLPPGVLAPSPPVGASPHAGTLPLTPVSSGAGALYCWQRPTFLKTASGCTGSSLFSLDLQHSPSPAAAGFTTMSPAADGAGPVAPFKPRTLRY